MKNWGATFRVTVLIWAVLCVYCLCSAEQRQVPVYEPAEEPATETVAVAAVIEPEDSMEHLPSIVNATLTHYCICEKCCGKTPDHPAYGITASGRKAEPYVSVAVDPFLIPLGSTVFVQYEDGEIAEYRADDTGSAVVGAHIDLCVSDHQEANELGRKTVKVWWSE